MEEELGECRGGFWTSCSGSRPRGRVSSVKTDSGYFITSLPSTPLRYVLGYDMPPSPHFARKTGARRRRGSGLESVDSCQ